MAIPSSLRPHGAPPVDHAAAWHDDLAYRSVVAATADKAGADFFRQLVRQLATALGVEYAFIAEFAGSPARVRTVALWGRGEWLPDLEYDLAGTPCEEVAQGKLCHHRDGVQQRFPKDVALVDMGARGYLGVPLLGADGAALGHLAIIDTKPIPDEPRLATLVHLFADRARVELERLRAELVLDRASQALEVRLEQAQGELKLARGQVAALYRIQRAVAGHLDRRALFGAVAEALRGVVPAARVILFVPSEDPAMLDVYAAYGDTGVQFFAGEKIPRDGTVAGWVAAHGTTVVVARTEDVRARFPVSYERLRREGMDSMVVLPLVSHGRCVGVLTLMGERAGAWDAVPATLLDEMAASVAVALDNCIAYEELERSSRERQALLDVNVAVGHHLEREKLFRALAVCLRDVLPSDRFGIELPLDGDRLQAHVLSTMDAGDVPIRVEPLPAAGTACRWTEEHRTWIVASSREELRERFPVTFDVMSREQMESLCAVPLLAGHRCIGVLFFMARQRGVYASLRRGLLERVAAAVAVALDNCLAHEEVRRLRDRLAAENVYLQEEIRQEHDFREIVGRSPNMLAMLARIETVAPTDTTVLILGETGTGKELIARAIHDRSARRDRPLVKVNCAALSAGLVESELFGHVRGAFTGALTDRVGRFELADGGTIFLDEIGELSLETQVKLLRVMQEREFEPVGSSRTRTVDTRIIAATNRDLEGAVADGKFRADLYYRLNVIPIQVPPLRERPGDVRLLVHQCIARYARERGKRIEGVSRETMEQLEAYDWPGNVRELQNVIERAVVLSSGPTLVIEPEVLAHRAGRPDVPGDGKAPASHPDERTLEAVQRRHIEDALARSGWVIEGVRGAAAALGINPNTLRSRMKKLGIRRPTA
jgi:formate hydrogenlyase transcriptional activator